MKPKFKDCYNCETYHLLPGDTKRSPICESCYGLTHFKPMRPTTDYSSFAPTTFKPSISKPLPTIDKVLFNNPATIVLWSDGTKTVVKKQDGDAYDPEKGLAMAIAKRALGNEGNYYNEIKKWVDTSQLNVTVNHIQSNFPKPIYSDGDSVHGLR